MMEQLSVACGGCLALSVVIVVIAFIWGWLQPRIVTVRDEERVVIYSRGRFKRIAGPGWVFFLGAFDKIERRVNVLSRPDDYSVANLFVGGIPVGLTINIWCRFDPQTAAGENRDKLIQMLRFSDFERRQQMEVLLRTALVHRLADLERERNLPQNAGFFAKLEPALPGLPPNDHVLQETRKEVQQSWQSLGVVLDNNMPWVITGLQLSDEMGQLFRRGRVVASLHDQYPQLPDDTVAQIAAGIEGIALSVETLKLDSNLGSNARVERFTNLKGGSKRVKYDTAEAAPESATGSDEVPAPETVPSPPPRLSKSDLQVLKRVPPNQGSDRASA
jgi:hypothetical protein